MQLQEVWGGSLVSEQGGMVTFMLPVSLHTCQHLTSQRLFQSLPFLIQLPSYAQQS